MGKSESDPSESSGTKTAPIIIQSKNSSFNAGIVLDETNYDVWCQMMEMHIAEKEKLSFIHGKTAPPTEKDTSYDKWYTDNQRVKRWLLMSTSPEIMKRYICLPTAREIWKALSKAFYDGADELQVFTLNQRAFSAKQDGRTLSIYYGELNEIFGKLDHHNKGSKECEKDVELYRKSIERQRVHIFLAGLDCEFDQIRGDILRCTHCDQSGHTKSRCFELVGYPDWWDHNRDPRKKNSHKNSTSAVVESKPELQGEYQEEVLNLDLQISKEVELSTREEVAELNAQDMDELNLGNGEHLEKEVSSLSLASESLEPQEANTPNNHLLAEDAHDMAKPSRKQLPPRHNRETFAPVAKINTIRVLLSLVSNLNWPLQQFDVKNAFLHGELFELVYIDLPPGCMIPEKHTQKVFRLKRSLYGLKQSPRTWFGRFTKSMKAFGYNQSNADHTLFLKKQHGKITVLIVYVDDMVVTGNGPEERKALQSYLFKEFKMKEFGPLKFFLGIEVSRSIKACKPTDTPMEEGLKLSVESNQVPVNKGRYQRLVGSGNILRYLKSSPGKGILFTKNADCQNVDAYVDADWAGEIDDRRSTSGYFTFVGGNLVSWRSRKQKVVARLSAEAEFGGLALGLCETLWLRLLLIDLDFPPSNQFNCIVTTMLHVILLIIQSNMIVRSMWK
nr:uncharacterized protein LOC112803971 [Arachis hypogaea]